ncbi:CBO0543 family protein [Bacillus sp. Marseille-P3661]|uniref:CBO0543 family protein n=1 Tax=Bacillus sp. Marseille-P3661 TaxID=1936234 RepID=UPI000C84327D|nr:CBO0543 family protein [Bacillus sp. Marseille-P3661]
MTYKKEKIIELSSWVAMVILLIKFIPKNKLREAHLAFLFKQLITWLFGLIVVENGNISYPFRTFFKKSIKSSFTFEYFVFPGMCALFNAHYPEKRSKYFKTFYYIVYTSVIVFLEVIALRFTKLIHYENWKWYWSFVSIWFSYYLSRMYQVWFFKDKKKKFFEV